MQINITEKAKQKIESIAKNGNVDTVIFGVEGGGCSGFMYVWNLAKSVDLDDDWQYISISETVQLATDSMSFMYVQGCTIDYVEDLTGSRLVVNNPLAVSSCGCGESVAF